MSKQYQYKGIRGCVSYRKCRRTGAVIAVYHAEQAGMCAEGGPWVTSCETHGSVVNHKTLRRARGYAPYPDDWCDVCQQLMNQER